MFNPNFKKSIKALGLAAISFSLILSPSFAVNAAVTNIFRSDFDNSTISSIGGFEIVTGNIDLVVPNNPYNIDTKDNTYIDLNGDGPASITTPNNLNYEVGDELQLIFDYVGNFSPGCPAEIATRAVKISVGGIDFTLSVVELKFEQFNKKFVTSQVGKTPLVFTSQNKGPCGLMIGNVRLDLIVPDKVSETPTTGGSITIGNSTVSTSSSTSSLLSSSTTSNSESQSSILGNSKNSGVLAFEVQKPESSKSDSSSKAIDPSTTKILVSTETKKVIDSAKGGTFRTGGF